MTQLEVVRSQGVVPAGRSLWDPVTIGVDTHGELVRVVLPGGHWVIGGQTGGGKSSLLQLIVAAGAFDPDVELILLDGKLVELYPWAGCASRAVWWDVDEAIGVLDELLAECQRRLRFITQAPGIKRKVTRDDGLGLKLVAIDELALFCKGPRKSGEEFSNRLRLLVQLCRATGIIVVVATSRPSHDVIPTSLRDLFPSRWCGPCPDDQSSDIVLGPRWAARGYSAARISSADPGVGLLLHEGTRPKLVRVCYLADTDLERLIPRAEALRASADHQAGGAGQTAAVVNRS